MRKEDTIAKLVAAYLNAQYPRVIYHFDTGTGATKSIGMAMRDKRLNKWRGYADLFIAHPSKEWHGLFLELKAETPFKLNGDLKKDTHLSEQFNLLLTLQTRGYMARFAVGFDGARKLIDEYLK